MQTFEKRLLFERSVATFSDDMRYRFLLRRVWGGDETNILAGCFMNPSTANEMKNDPTLASWQSRAEKLGYDGFSVVNAFGFRSPNPGDLLTIVDPIGAENDSFILAEAKVAKTFVVGWGMPPKPVRWRCAYVAKMLENAGVSMLCLGVNSDGSPRHPLYTDHSLPFVPWTPLKD